MARTTELAAMRDGDDGSDAGAAPKLPYHQRVVKAQRIVCEDGGGKFTSTLGRAFGFSTTSCTGATGGDYGCSNTPSTATCTPSRTSPPPSRTTVTTVGDKRGAANDTPAVEDPPASTDEPSMTPLDEAEG